MFVVTLEEMKNYLRVDFSDDDALIGGMLLGADHPWLLFGARKEGF